MKRALFLVVAASLGATLMSCGDGRDVDTNPCQLAVEKQNECHLYAWAANSAAGDPYPSTPRLEFSGECNDQATLWKAGGTKEEFPFRSWSIEYLACNVDPQTCRCPGQPWPE